MIRLFWAFFERLIQRGASALMTLIVALVVGPQEYGFYAVMALAFSVYQALVETTARQVGPTWLLAGKTRSMRRFAFGGGLAGTVCMVLTLAFLAVGKSTSINVLLYLPIVAAPLMGSIGLVAVARLELADEWRYLSSIRTLVSALSLLLAGLVLVVWQSILAATAQTFLVEVLFAVLVLRKAQKAPLLTRPLEAPQAPMTLSHPLLLNGLGWSQGQSDRVVLAFFASVTRLGEYTFAVSLGRAVTDAISSGIVAIIRRDLAHSTGPVMEVVGATIRRAALLVAVVQVVVLLFVTTLGQLVPPQWSEAMRAVPIVSCLALPALWSWAVAAYRLHRGEAATLYATQIISMLLGVVVAVGVSKSLIVGSSLLLLREILQSAMRVWQARALLPLRVLRESLILFGITGSAAAVATLVLF